MTLFSGMIFIWLVFTGIGELFGDHPVLGIVPLFLAVGMVYQL